MPIVPADFAAKLRSAYGTGVPDGMSDEQLIVQHLKRFPGDRQFLDDPVGMVQAAADAPAPPQIGTWHPPAIPEPVQDLSTNEKVALGAVRMGAPMIGSTIGGVLGGLAATPALMAGPEAAPAVAAGAMWGSRAGGALAGGLGELGAETYEKLVGPRDRYSSTDLGINTALGGLLPGPLAAGTTIPQAILKRGAQGAVLGEAAGLAKHGIDDQRLPTLDDVAETGAGGFLGGALGGLIEGGLHAWQGRAPRPITADPPAPERPLSAPPPPAAEPSQAPLLDPRIRPYVLPEWDPTQATLDLPGIRPTTSNFGYSSPDAGFPLPTRAPLRPQPTELPNQGFRTPEDLAAWLNDTRDTTPWAPAEPTLGTNVPDPGTLDDLQKWSLPKADQASVADGPSVDPRPTELIQERLQKGIADLDQQGAALKVMPPEQLRQQQLAELRASLAKAPSPEQAAIRRQIRLLDPEMGQVSSELAQRLGFGLAGAAAGATQGDTPEERAKLAVVLGLLGAAAPSAWAGAKSFEPSPSLSAKENELLRRQQAGTSVKDAGALTATQKFRRDYGSRFAPIDDLERTITKQGGTISPEEAPSNVLRVNSGGTSARIEAGALELRDLMREADKAGVGQELRAYANNRAMQHGLTTLEQKALTDPEIAARLANHEALPLDYNRAELAAEQAAFNQNVPPAKQQVVQQLADRLFQFNRESLDRMRPLIGDQRHQELVARGMEYAPLYRRRGTIQPGDDVFTVFTDELDHRLRTAGFSVKQIDSIKQIEGHWRTTEDPIEASLRLRAITDREVARNEGAKSFVDLRQHLPGVARELKQGQTVAAHEGEITYRDNGQVRRFAVPQEYAKILNLADAQSIESVAQLFGKVMGVLRKTAATAITTANVPFAAANAIRDFHSTRWLAPGQRRLNPIDFLKWSGEYGSALVDRAAKGPKYRDALDAKALFGTIQRQITPRGELSKQRTLNPLALVVRGVEELNKIIEETPKIAGYARLKQQMGPVEAAAVTRRFYGSPDFADMGEKIAPYNWALLFFNPAIQGVRQTVAGVRRDPARALTGIGSALLTSLALDQYNRQYIAEDGRPEIEHVPDSDKQNHFVIVLPQVDEASGRHKYLAIPKAHIAKAIYNPIQASIEYDRGNPDVNKTQVALDMVSNVLPTNASIDAKHPVSSLVDAGISTMQPALRAPLELMADRVSFTGVPIEGPALQQLDKSARYTSRQGPTLQTLGQYTSSGRTGLSPAQLDYLVSTFLSTPGRQVVSALDSLQDDTRQRTGNAVLDPLLQRFYRGGRDQVLEDERGALYDAYGSSKSAADTLSNAVTRRPSRAPALVSDPELMGRAVVAPTLQKITDALSLISRQREAILSGELPVPAGERPAVLRSLRDQEVQLAGLAKQFAP